MPLITSALIIASIDSLFLQMPKELLPYIDDVNRKVLIETSVGEDVFGDSCQLKRVGDCCLDIKTSKSSRVQLIYNKDEDSSHVYTITTYSAPAAESVIRRYDCQWKALGVAELNMPLEEFLVDSLSDDECEKAIKNFEFTMLMADYVYKTDDHARSPMDDTSSGVKFSVEFPLLSGSEKKELESSFLQRTVKIQGLNFK